MKFCKMLRENRRKRMEKIRPCKYPFGNPGTSGFYFCEKPIENERFVYCNDHAKLCYINFDLIKDKPRRSVTIKGR